MKSCPLVASLVFVPFLVGGCGGSSSEQPTPVAAATPTPTPAPTPTPKPLSVIPACTLAASQPGAAAVCTDPAPRYTNEVNVAVDRVMAERPELFDFADTNAGAPRVRDYASYMTAVAAALGEAGVCGKIEPEAEIAIKRSNSFSEQWIVATSSDYVRRKYVGACAPATF